MRIHTDEEIDAVLEAWGTPLTPENVNDANFGVGVRPVVEKGCICPNGHEPDAQGLIFTSPSCIEHGCRTRWPFKSQLNLSERTIGTVHSRNRD